MATKRDYYEILGISKDASKEDIKRAYKNLAKRHHPDVNSNPEATEKFKEISEAYAVLSDDNKRSQYDQFGHAGFDQRFSQEDIFRGFDFDIFSDIFGDNSGFDSIFDMFFGKNKHNQNFVHGNDLRYDLEITLKEVAEGTKKDIYYFKNTVCSTCSGTGSKDKKLEKCQHCNGSGRITHTQRTPFGYFQQTTLCNYCHGVGEQIKNRCKTCNGSGLEKVEHKVKVTIPAGVDQGSRLVLRGQGDDSKNRSPGDLYIVIIIKKDPLFERREDDIYLNYPINFTQATLGDKIIAPTLDGDVEMKIPQGTQSNTLFRLKGKGIKHLQSSGKGDQYVNVIVKTPTSINKEQKELLIKLGKTFKKN